MDLYAAIADERLGMADLLAGLTPDQSDTQSLCAAWTVHDVGAHLLMPLVTSMPRFGFTMLRNRMDFDRTSESLTAAVGQRSDAEIATELRAKATHRFTPPGLGPEAPLSDLMIHGQDIRRPLGIARDFDDERLATVLDFVTGQEATKGFIPRGRVDGLSFRATDLDWSSGEGPEVSGPGEAIMMAVAGRSVALADLSGPGVAVLADRLPPA